MKFSKVDIVDLQNFWRNFSDRSLKNGYPELPFTRFIPFPPIVQTLIRACSVAAENNISHHKAKVLSLPVSGFVTMGMIMGRAPGYMVEEYNAGDYKKVPPSEDNGDRIKKNGDVFEFKHVTVTVKQRHVHWKRIKAWQDKVKEYWLVVYDLADKDRLYKFVLTKVEAERECRVLNAKPLDYTAKANRDNKNQGLSLPLTITKGNKHFDRWCSLYLKKEKE